MAEKNSSSNNDRIKKYFKLQTGRAKEILSSKNNLYYVSLILLSVIVLTVAWLIESNTNGVASKVFENIDEKYIYLIVLTTLFVGIFISSPDYLCVYKSLKTRRFWSIVGGVLTWGYYNITSVFRKNGDILYPEYLSNFGIDKDFVNNLSSSRTASNKISNAIYSMLVVILGSIFVIGRTNIFLYVMALIALLIRVSFVLFILYFDRYKAQYLTFIGKICKLLYRCKIIKDYEKLYNNLVTKLMYYGSALKFNKVYLMIQIVCGCFAKFLKHLTLFFVVCMFNIASWDLLIEILFKCAILDLIIGYIPIPSGVLIYELLFLTLFRNTFFSGYVLYGMVMYRIITYFAVCIAFGFGCLVGVRKKLICIHQNGLSGQDEVATNESDVEKNNKTA